MSNTDKKKKMATPVPSDKRSETAKERKGATDKQAKEQQSLKQDIVATIANNKKRSS